MTAGATAGTMTLDLSTLDAGGDFRGWRSSHVEQWGSLGPVDGDAAVTLTLSGGSIVTLTTMADPAPATGNSSPPLPIYQVADAVQASTLRRAAMIGDVTWVTQQIANGANVNAADPATGWTPLHAAAAGLYPGCEEIVTRLLAAGANPTARDVEGLTPMHAAAMNQWVEYRTDWFAKPNILNKLKAAGGSFDARDDAGRTPLMWSAMQPASTGANSYTVAVPLTLVNAGADRALRDDAGLTAYDYAAQEHKAPFLPLLRAMEGQPSTDTRAPFARYGAFSRDANAVSLVIAEDVTATLDAADVQITNRATGQTVTNWTFSDRFSTGLTIARATFANRLPDGNYRLTVAAGAFADPSGRASTGAIVVDFGVMNGDANGDRRVDFRDLLVVAQNYGKAGRTFSQGDFDGDGETDFQDLLVLAQRYGTALPTP